MNGLKPALPEFRCFSLALKCLKWRPAAQPLIAKQGMVTMLSTGSGPKEMQPMPHARFVRPIVFTYLSLLLTLNCQNNSWGKFWDVSAAAVDPLAVCRSAVAGDAFSMICVPANTTGFSRGWAGLATLVHTVASISSFAIGKYEVIYSDWETVRLWAIANTYSFANNGQPGSAGGTRIRTLPQI
ncbi:hypothetical protein [Turneriella parva]|uniref:Uncharacterized protein n=1 Tax=Turneriella parva (strain ATCC BAA-1111 / DSM 21527 / NCTC 11395 / H) TaxID=869212 RepID=I4B3S4_TURPD|nr:hypothetical protein [Turneriella parva]AFM11931.1 hypothetical protein Turpa_1283 [Turneriella parva DSM 21527]